jgi:hypothetical protein
MPSLFLSSPQLSGNIRSPLIKASKRSFTLGLGEQRDLQGRITISFRDFDKKFNISRSGILISSNDLTRTSNESLSMLPSDEEEDRSDSCSNEEEEEFFSEDVNPCVDNCVESCTVPSEDLFTPTENTPTTIATERKNSMRRFLRRSSSVAEEGQCRIL